VLAVGGVNKLLLVPGVAEYAHGFRGLPEVFACGDAADPLGIPLSGPLAGAAGTGTGG
jgi:hypothetical protein